MIIRLAFDNDVFLKKVLHSVLKLPMDSQALKQNQVPPDMLHSM
jgi:hypothetical protein